MLQSLCTCVTCMLQSTPVEVDCNMHVRLQHKTPSLALCVSAAGRLEEALQCALTYLLFHEGEEFMKENADYYREELGHDAEPREVRS